VSDRPTLFSSNFRVGRVRPTDPPGRGFRDAEDIINFGPPYSGCEEWLRFLGDNLYLPVRCGSIFTVLRGSTTHAYIIFISSKIQE
jgi:hypothetical protein